MNESAELDCCHVASKLLLAFVRLTALCARHQADGPYSLVGYSQAAKTDLVALESDRKVQRQRDTLACLSSSVIWRDAGVLQ